jgi:sulfur transfer complex TusBCD TusB component (DsrH family)
MKVLQIVSCAYRATIEEQDDTIVWLTQAMRNAGGELDVLLTGNAVNYALTGQDASGLAIGAWRQTQPPRIEADIARMAQSGIRVLALAEDVQERGLQGASMNAGVEVVTSGDAISMMGAYDQVWRW